MCTLEKSGKRKPCRYAYVFTQHVCRDVLRVTLVGDIWYYSRRDLMSLGPNKI